MSRICYFHRDVVFGFLFDTGINVFDLYPDRVDNVVVYYDWQH